MPHSGHDSGACITRRVGSVRCRASRGDDACAVLLSSADAAWGRLNAQHPCGQAVGAQTCLQLLDPSPQLGDDRLLLGYHRQQSLSARALQTRSSLHHSLMTQLLPGTLAPFRFTSASLNSYAERTSIATSNERRCSSGRSARSSSCAPWLSPGAKSWEELGGCRSATRPASSRRPGGDRISLSGPSPPDSTLGIHLRPHPLEAGTLLLRDFRLVRVRPGPELEGVGRQVPNALDPSG